MSAQEQSPDPLIELLQATREQTDAINRMSEMLAILITALAEDQDIEELQTHYMDGSPIG